MRINTNPNWNPYQELIEGRLCEKGYLKERYDEEKKDLTRDFTEKGIQEIGKMMLDPKWRKVISEIIRKMPVSFSRKQEYWVILNKVAKDNKEKEK